MKTWEILEFPSFNRMKMKQLLYFQKAVILIQKNLQFRQIQIILIPFQKWPERLLLETRKLHLSVSPSVTQYVYTHKYAKTKANSKTKCQQHLAAQLRLSGYCEASHPLHQGISCWPLGTANPLGAISWCLNTRAAKDRWENWSGLLGHFVSLCVLLRFACSGAQST